MATGSGLLLWTVLAVAADPMGPTALTPAEKSTLEQRSQVLRERLSRLPPSPAAADAAVPLKGLDWALRYDREFTPNDRRLLERALVLTEQRLAEVERPSGTGTVKTGKTWHGYVSQVDGSVQPYGVVVPAGYDPQRASRLDVVLHGSTRPVGMSELRFLGRFDDASPGPDQPYLELHPLGRVENCYRWSGETDVFEAIDDVCRRYSIDRRQIVLRGMSMGASGTWHLGLKHPDYFAALGPYCGYVDTHRFSETPLPNFVRIGPLPDHQELGLHMLDSVDYAANAGMVPVVACMGEKDVFFAAHEIMGEAMQREGLQLVNLISPGTGHVIDPVTQAEQLRRIAAHVAHRPPSPRELRFVTWTLKYNRCYWLELLGLNRHYQRAEVHARRDGDTLEVPLIRNVTEFALHELETIRQIRLGETVIAVPPGTPRVELAIHEGKWRLQEGRDVRRAEGKRPGLQGPIDDALTRPFLCVRGTGTPWNVATQRYADSALARFAEEWRHYFRGELPVRDDRDVTAEDVRTKNLILFGDPGSNTWIAQSLRSLPLRWTRDTVELAGRSEPAATTIPVLIHPNPLPGGEGRYLVLNSGHTFHEAELSKLNYLLFPRWGDWALLRAAPPTDDPLAPLETVLSAGYFDEQWGLGP